MHKDEIIEEVRAIRAKLFEQASGNMAGLFAQLRELEAKETRPVVSLTPRRPNQDDEETS